jgi:hypothetical protein
VKFFSFVGVDLFAQVIHFDKLELVGIGHRLVNALAVYELRGRVAAMFGSTDDSLEDSVSFELSDDALVVDQTSAFMRRNLGSTRSRMRRVLRTPSTVGKMREM